MRVLCVLMWIHCCAAIEPLFVSLGSSCEAASQLRHLNLRTAAFPLDWVLSIENDGLIALIEEDFAEFLSPHCLAVLNQVPCNTHYRLYCPHEGNWEDDHEQAWKRFQKKYQVRIERFRALEAYEGPLFFIRAVYFHAENPAFLYRDPENRVISDGWAMQLYGVLNKRFPGVDRSEEHTLNSSH